MPSRNHGERVSRKRKPGFQKGRRGSGERVSTRAARRRAVRVAWLVGAAIVVILFVAIWPRWRAWNAARWADGAERQLRLAHDRGDLRQVVSLAESILQVRPSAFDVAVMGSQAAERLGDHRRALALLDHATAGDHPLRSRAFLAKGLLLLKCGRAAAAEEAFRTVLVLEPDHPTALRRLCDILFAEGRRFEEIPFRFRLLQLGRFELDDLFLLADPYVLGGDEGQLKAWREAEPDAPYASLGLARLALRRGAVAEAIGPLESIVKRFPDCLQAQADLGMAYLAQPEAEGERLLKAWREGLPSPFPDHPDIWGVFGLWAQRRGQWHEAVRCFGEVIARQPNDLRAHQQMHACLVAIGMRESAEAFRVRAGRLSRLVELCYEMHETSVSYRGLAEAARLCEQLGRYWEAAGWCRVLLDAGRRRRREVIRDPGERRELQEAESACRALLSRLRPRLAASPPMVDPSEQLAAHIDLDRFPRPSFELPGTRRRTHRIADFDRHPRFRDVTKEAGIVFQYEPADDPAQEGRRMLEFTGGGVGVLDYDQDGWPDLYWTQGGQWPVQRDTAPIDRLFRNRLARRFEDVTHAARLGDREFSQGVACGDFNNDGWPDLLVGNIGRNALYVNNGDGTFTEVSGPSGLDATDWTTSCAIADLDSDGAPDLYCTNYLAGERALTQICNRGGKPRACSPMEFEAAIDRVYFSSGDGSFRDLTKPAGFAVPNGRGLGCVVADFDDNGRVEVFIANDMTENFLFVPTQASENSPRFQEIAAQAGVAVQRDGNAQACMGIGLADVDGDLRLDLFVTNFYREWNTLYRRQPGDTLMFLDDSHAWNTVSSSMDTLGFGTQFLDVELDGLPDLVITNGHVDDFRFRGAPYRMVPQVLRNVGGRFVECPSSELGPFFQRPVLGRGLARIDYDRDGREDFAVSHLDVPGALVRNVTDHPGQFLALVLVGRRGSRDAVGARVEIAAGSDRWVLPVTAGDGYLASNEKRLVFGLGRAAKVDHVEIRWPGGRVDRFESLATGRTYKCIEGRRPVVWPLAERD